MRTDFRALFQNADADLAPGLGRKLLQPDRRRQTCRSAADDHDVIFHALALNIFSHAGIPLDFFGVFMEGSAKRGQRYRK